MDYAQQQSGQFGAAAYSQEKPREANIRESLAAATNSIECIDDLISRLEDAINGPQPRPANAPIGGQTNVSAIEPPYIGVHTHGLQIASRLSAIIGRLETLRNRI